MTLFDSHCHFDFDVFNGGREALWAECQARDIAQLLIPGIGIWQWSRALSIAEALPGIWMAADVHPWYLDELGERLSGEQVQLMADCLAQHHCVALGERGIDKCIDAPLDQQLTLFAQHLGLTCDYAMPLVI